MPKLPLVVVALVMVSLASVALWLDRSSAGSLTGVAKSTSAGEVTAGAVYSAKFTDLQGSSRTLGQWDQKLLIVNFWATWCAPCKEEIPILVKLQAKYGDKNLQIVGIAADSSSNVGKFSQNANINYPVFIHEAGAIEFSKRLGNRFGLLPHTVVFKPGGDVIYSKLGPITEADLGDVIVKNTPNGR